MKKTFKILSYFFFGFFCLVLIIILRPIIRIRIGKLNTSRIGHLATNTALYYTKNILLKENNYLDLFYCDKIISNKYLLKLWSKKINILPRILLFSVFNLIIKFNYTQKYHYADNNYGGDQDPQQVLQKFEKILEIPSTDEVEGKIILEKLGTDNRKIILFFARDEAHTNYLLKKNTDIRFHSYRNANIDNFLLAAEELASRGYALIRMGSIVKKKINSNSKFVIDYSNSSYRSDFMDIYLQSKCEFFITSGTGINEVARLFKKPLLYVSFAPYAYSPTYISKIICIYKKVFDRKNNKLLSLSEMFNSGVAQAYHRDVFEEKDIDLIENTPEEIKVAAFEMIEAIENNFKIFKEDIDIQKKFWDIYYENIQKFATYRLGDRDSYKMQIGKKFLKDNLYLLD